MLLEEIYLGSPSINIKQQKARFAAIARLPEMRKEFRQMQKDVEQLKTQQQPRRDAA